MSAGINTTMGRRSYTEITLPDGWEEKIPLRDCPEACPECGTPFTARATINVYNGMFDTGGEGVTCAECGYKEFQVIDTWYGTKKR